MLTGISVFPNAFTTRESASRSYIRCFNSVHCTVSWVPGVYGPEGSDQLIRHAFLTRVFYIICLVYRELALSDLIQL